MPINIGGTEVSLSLMREYEYNSVIQTGLILYLDARIFDTTPVSTWYDFSKSEAHTTLYNSPTYSTSFGGGSLQFNSTRRGEAPMTNLRPTSGITQEAWFYATSLGSQVFIGSQYGSSSNNSYAIWWNGSAWAGGVNTTGGSFDFVNVTTTGQSINTWYHFVHTYDGATQRLYVNNTEIGSKSTTGSLVYDTNNTVLAIGNDFNSGYNGGASIGVLGYLAAVSIYERPLSATEIEHNYNVTKHRYGY